MPPRLFAAPSHVIKKREESMTLTGQAKVLFRCAAPLALLPLPSVALPTWPRLPPASPSAESLAYFPHSDLERAGAFSNAPPSYE